MNVKELREKLSKYPDDMEVRVYSDHGQTSTVASRFGVRFTYASSAESYSVTDSWTQRDMDDDPEEYDGVETHSFVEIAD